MKKLLEFQKKVGAIAKDSKNPFFKSNYFDINKLIEEVKPVLNEVGLILLQPLDNIEGQPVIRTILIDPDNTEQLNYAITLPNNIDPQKMGSAITYYRRYAIQSLLFLQAEDDDGNSTVEQRPATVEKQDCIFVRFPYSKENVSAIKACEGARWQPDDEKWLVFDTPQNRAKVKAMDTIKTVYNEDSKEITL